jgi:hypothetical protein
MRSILAVVFAVNIGFGAAFANEAATLKAKVEQATTVAPVGTPAPATGSGFTDTVCTSGGNTRKVELISASAETGVPCEVHYKKETEQPGHDQVVYSANNDIGFCHAKASAFVDRLNSMGWTCIAK